MNPSRIRPLVAVALATLLLAAGLVIGGVAPVRTERAQAQEPPPCTAVNQDLCKINHMVFIMQENRSFDHYFGTYRSPDATQQVDGIPRKPSGAIKACIPNPVRHICQKPYHSKALFNVGGPHSADAADADINRGKMDGFIKTALWGSRTGYCVTHWQLAKCNKLTGPAGQPDQISYHTRREIPSYWSYADNGVLYDRFFEPVASWTLPAHMYLVSAWAATCKDDFKASTCKSDRRVHKAWNYPWADITVLMDKYDVSWNYFVGDKTKLDCDPRSAPEIEGVPKPLSPCNPTHSEDVTVEGWMPIAWFQNVRENNGRENILHQETFYTRVADGQLADVTWIIPSGRNSEHPGHASIGPGQKHVTQVVNAIAGSPFWDDTAIFVSWDDWGGFYDHVRPKKVDNMGYGLRVPAFMISPYAKKAYVDHQILSTDAYLKFIEDRWMGGERLDGKDMNGWDDPRPNTREEWNELGDLANSFDFDQTPLPPIVLPIPSSKGPDLWPYPDTRQRGYGAGG